LLHTMSHLIHRLPPSTLFPYTTLFRSHGGTLTGTNDVEPVILIAGSNASVAGANIDGPGEAGLWILSPNACVNNNILTGTFNSGGIVVSDPTTNLGMGNILNGNSSNLGVGECSPPRPCSGN